MRNQHTIVLSAVALALCTSCSSRNSTVAAANSSGPQTVEVVEVIAQPLKESLRLPGELQPYETVAVFPKVNGFVDWIGVDRGSRVKKGEEIVRLVAPELVSQRSEAQSRAESAQSQLLAAEAKLASDQGTYEKLLAASKTPGVVAGNDLLVAQKAVEADQSQVKAFAGTAEAAKQALRAVSETEQYLHITAPFNGVITERNMHPGALVGPNQSTPIVRIETLDHLRLVVPVPEGYLATVPEGATVNFTVPAFPNQSFSGKVARISHAVDEKTRTMPVELDVKNASGKLTPGSFSQVIWPVHRSRPSLLVPNSAIANNLERTFVVRVRDGKADWVDVKTGASSGDLTEVFGDLHPGDQVAKRGTDELAPGTPVKVERSTTANK